MISVVGLGGTMSNLGDLKIQLKLDIKPYAASIKSAIKMAAIYKKQAGGLLKLKSPKVDVSKIDAELKKLESSLKKYETTAKTSGVSSSKFAKDLDTVSTSAVTTKGSLVALGSQLVIVGAALYMAVSRVAAFGLELLKLGSESSAIRSSFRNLSGKEGLDANNFLKDLKKNTAGAVSELTLMKTVSKGKFLGVDMKSMPTLLKFATIRAKEMGVETDYLVDSIVTGLGRKSPLILDNLGLTMNELDAAVIKVAKSHGKLITKVDEQTRAMYLTEAAVLVANDQIKQSSISLDSNAFMLERATSKWDDLKEAIGKSLSEDILGRLAQLDDNLAKIGVTADETESSLGKIAGTLIDIGTSTSMLFMLIDAFDILVDLTKKFDIGLTQIRMALSMTPPGQFLLTIIDWLTDAYNAVDRLLNKTASLGVPESAIYPLPPPGFKKKTTKKPPYIPPGGSNRSGTKGREQTEKEILSALEQEKKKLAALWEDHKRNEDSIWRQLEIYKDILKVMERIEYLKSGTKIKDIPFQTVEKGEPWVPILEPGPAKADITETDRYKATVFGISTLFDTLRNEGNQAWEDIFGTADSLAEKFFQNLTMGFLDLLMQHAQKSLINMIFGGVLGPIGSIFGGGGATGASSPIGGMPGGSASGFGGDSLVSGLINRAPAVNNYNNISQPPIIIHLKSMMKAEDLVAEGMPGYVKIINDPKL